MCYSNSPQPDVKYVPIMGGEWDWYKDCYEPLTIVTHKGTFLYIHYVCPVSCRYRRYYVLD